MGMSMRWIAHSGLLGCTLGAMLSISTAHAGIISYCKATCSESRCVSFRYGAVCGCCANGEAYCGDASGCNMIDIDDILHGLLMIAEASGPTAWAERIEAGLPPSPARDDLVTGIQQFAEGHTTGDVERQSAGAALAAQAYAELPPHEADQVIAFVQELIEGLTETE